MANYHLAKNLLRLRTFFGYTQKYLSEEVGISRSSYSNYERGIRLPELDIAIRLAQFYQISLDCLVLSPDPAQETMRKISESSSYGHTAITPVGSRILLDGPETKMHLTYKRLSPLTQREIQAYVRFKEQWEQAQ